MYGSGASKETRETGARTSQYLNSLTLSEGKVYESVRSTCQIMHLSF